MSERKSKGYWQNQKNRLGEAKMVIRELKVKVLPSYNVLVERGYSALGSAIMRHSTFRETRRLLGEPERKLIVKTQYTQFSKLERDLQEIIEERGHFPSREELYASGRSIIISGIKKYGGFCVVRKKWVTNLF